MKPLPDKYDHKEAEKRWQQYWERQKTYAWDSSGKRENNFVIDTPPPTVSGVLHMGHFFSYTQTDFVARYQRMKGKNVFYPMGFDDNGLPTERLVEKITKRPAHKYDSREEFIEVCRKIVAEAENDFETFFKAAALSVDWSQLYHTIDDESRKLSQLSFLDLYNKGEIYRALKPMLWDPVDQTAIAQAEVVDRELDSHENYLVFGVDDGNGNRIDEFQVMTTRPELLPACVAVMCDPKVADKYKGKLAIRPISGMRVPIIPDDKVDAEKGTGMVMCCTYGDETDVYWFDKYKEEYNLPLRIILNKYGKYDADLMDKALGNNPNKAKIIGLLAGLTMKKAREDVFIKALEADNSLADRKPIKHMVKCAERSGAPLEIIPTHQWFIKVTDKKEALKKKARECNWYPDFMRIRMEQWIDGLNWDWCISRQRYFGVPFPVWYVHQKPEARSQKSDNPPLNLPPFTGEARNGQAITAQPQDLPINPLEKLPTGYQLKEKNSDGSFIAIEEATGNEVELIPEADVMDTWNTSSISPQLSSKGLGSPLGGEQANSSLKNDELSRGGAISSPPTASANASATPTQGGSDFFILDHDRHSKLFPADLRPQAHEIIRTWAFYTLVKAYLHEDEAERDKPGKGIPWKNLMISGWCLAADKTKMSKSKGNVVSPVNLIEEKGTDAVRYWASTSKLGNDVAFSEDLLKIGKKLITKLWNASKFAAIHIEKLDKEPAIATEEVEQNIITETLDLWILSKLHKAVAKATSEFEKYEYADARVAIEDFFWNDFCDNYLEMVKVRAYDEKEENPAGQKSAVHTIYHCLEALLRLFAPFVPHITEELYSHIFDAKHEQSKSIHARGNWPDAGDYPVNEEVEGAGEDMVGILEAVRKIKADKKLSIKAPISVLRVMVNDEVSHIKTAESDLKNVTASEEIKWFGKTDKTDEGFPSETIDNGKLKVSAEFIEMKGN